MTVIAPAELAQELRNLAAQLEVARRYAVRVYTYWPSEANDMRLYGQLNESIMQLRERAKEISEGKVSI